MKIERVTSKPRVTIEQFAEKHDLIMVIQDPISPSSGCSKLDGKFKVGFKGVQEVVNGILMSSRAWGATESDAINEYAKHISGKTIRRDGGKRINVPELAVYSDQ